MSKKHYISLKIIAEIILGIIVLFLIGLGFGAWKLSEGPINMEQFIPYIESEINNSSPDRKVEIGNLYLEWQGFENPLGLSAKDIVVSNDQGPFLFSPEIDLNISLRRLIIGQLKIEALWIRRIALSITRTKNGQIKLTGQKISEKQDVVKHVPATITLNNLIYDLPELDVFWIDQASIIYKDEISNKTTIFDPVTIFTEMNEKSGERSLSGFLTFPFGEKTSSNTVKVNFSTSSDPLILNLHGGFQKTPIDNFMQFMPVLPSGWDLNMVVDASFQIQLDNLWNLHQADVKLNAKKGQIFFPINGENDHVEVSDMSIHIDHDPKTDMASIKEFQIKVNDLVNVTAMGDVKNLQTPDKIAGDLKIAVHNLPQDYFSRYWPIEYSDNGAYRWLVKKMHGGVFKSISLHSAFDLKQTQRDDNLPLPSEIKFIRGEMAYEGLNIDYNKPMAAAKNISGSGKYDDIALTLNIDTADIGGMKTKNATLHFDDLLTSGTGLGTLKFPVSAPVQAVFDYIAAKPIQAFENVDFDPKNTVGYVDAVVDIEIPLLKNLPLEDVKVTVNGTVNGADIPNAFRGLSLSGGPYEIYATTQEIKVKGSGELQGKAITLDWHEYFSAKSAPEYVSKITADVVSNDAIRRAFIKNMADYFRGDASGEVTYIKSNNNRDARINLKLDLKKTAILVDDIGFNKKFGTRGNASMDVSIRDEELKSIKNIKITGKNISLQNGEIAFLTNDDEPYIKEAQLDKVIFNDNKFSLKAKATDNLLKINIEGNFLDARPFLTNKKNVTKKSQSRRPAEIGVKVSEVRSSDDTTLKNAAIYMKLDKNGQADQFEMDAKLGETGGEGDLFIRYTPEVADGLTLRVESNNAGETLRAFDLYPYIQGGQLQIAGKPITGGRWGDVHGRARINDFKVSNAPILLRLVNALSFQNFLQANALGFARLESDFRWERGKDGDEFTINNGTTSGASVALTFDGYISGKDDYVEINGTAAPLSEINSFISKIPVIGHLLTGGGALLAATYTIKGPSDDPIVSINPLSVLAPGIIRKMLFESGSPSKEKEATIPKKERTELN